MQFPCPRIRCIKRLFASSPIHRYCEPGGFNHHSSSYIHLRSKRVRLEGKPHCVFDISLIHVFILLLAHACISCSIVLSLHFLTDTYGFGCLTSRMIKIASSQLSRFLFELQTHTPSHWRTSAWLILGQWHRSYYQCNSYQGRQLITFGHCYYFVCLISLLVFLDWSTSLAFMQAC